MSAKRFYLVPAELSGLVLRNQWFRHLQVYMALKHVCRGQIVINTALISGLSEVLSISEKTVSRSISFLRERNWIGYSQKSGLSFIRGLDEIRIIENLPSNQAYWFDINKIRKIKSFVIASCYGEAIRKRRRAEVQKKGAPIRRPASLFYPLSLNYIAKIHGHSKSTGSIYRKLAEADGFIQVKEDLIPITPDEYRTIQEMKEPDEVKRLVRRKGKIYQQYSDHIKTNIKPKKRRSVFRTKSEPYIKGIYGEK